MKVKENALDISWEKMKRAPSISLYPVFQNSWALPASLLPLPCSLWRKRAGPGQMWAKGAGTARVLLFSCLKAWVSETDLFVPGTLYVVVSSSLFLFLSSIKSSVYWSLRFWYKCKNILSIMICSFSEENPHKCSIQLLYTGCIKCGKYIHSHLCFAALKSVL